MIGQTRRHWARLATPLLLLAVGLCIGCAQWKHDAKTYETVAASPLRDTEHAEKHHDKALEIISRCDHPNCFQCTCVGKSICNLHKAEDHLQKALVADVRYGPAHNTLGMLYYRQRKLYLAAWEFEYASQLMPERAEPLSNVGLVYEEAGRLGRAIEFYQMALELEPTNAEYLANLARAHLKQGNPLSEVRGMLSDVILHDTRPEFVAWAEDLLGENPIQPAGSESDGSFGGIGADPMEDDGATTEAIPPPAGATEQALPLQPPSIDVIE